MVSSRDSAQVVRARALNEDIVLCSWKDTLGFTLTSFSLQPSVKLPEANLMLDGLASSPGGGKLKYS